jgi:hypothetical protein
MQAMKAMKDKLSRTVPFVDDIKRSFISEASFAGIDPALTANELCTVLEALKESESLKKLDLTGANTQGQEGVAPLLASALAENSGVLRELVLAGMGSAEGSASLSSADICIIAEGAAKAPGLSKLLMGGGGEGLDAAAVRALAALVQESASLRLLQFRTAVLRLGDWNGTSMARHIDAHNACFTADDLTVAAGLLLRNHTTESLNLSGNPFGDAGVRALSPVLQHTMRLRSLDLRAVGMGDAGLAELAAALEANRTVAALDLRLNAFGPTGVRALADALLDHPTAQQVEVPPPRAAFHAAFRRALTAAPSPTGLPLLGLPAGRAGDSRGLGGAGDSKGALEQVAGARRS